MILALWSAAPLAAQTAAVGDGADAKPKTAETRDRSTVPISFLPPPLENATYSLGIYEAKSGKLVRTLHQSAAESTFTVGLNGFITQWDRKDDTGKTVPPGKYAARGYAVGALKVEGVAIHGNDWVSEDESLRIQDVRSIALIPEDNGLAMVAKMPGDHYWLMRFSGKDGALLWKQNLDSVFDAAIRADSIKLPETIRDNNLFGGISTDGDVIILKLDVGRFIYRIRDGIENTAKRRRDDSFDVFQYGTISDGKDGAFWMIGTLDDDTLVQFLPNNLGPGKMLNDLHHLTREEATKWLEEHTRRLLKTKPDEPKPTRVSASATEDRLYLLEKMPGWQRVRGLSWVETKDENGKKVSNWETFFERNIRTPDAALGLEDPATADAPSPVVELSLVKNELSPGKPAKAKLTADFDAKGSYLTTADGLRLRQISERANLRAVKLVKGKAAGSLTFFQTDGAAWDEFSIAGADKLMSFDAGEFELTATGEKPVEAKAPEPDF